MYYDININTIEFVLLNSLRNHIFILIGVRNLYILLHIYAYIFINLLFIYFIQKYFGLKNTYYFIFIYNY